ncbi:MAG: glycosyltransferase family 2 protein [Dehalococcoidia bacterium]|nr:glycosyltransferase family 2 protein [Dehalococcoidia bacterium]
MTEPLVSVIIPLFNGERFIADAIESVRLQTYTAREIVVVDDGSTDRGAEVAASTPGVQVIRQENQGVSVARNAGVANSRGEFLAFLDHDDRWLPEKLEVQVRELTAHPELGFVLCHLRYVLNGPLPRWFRGPVDGSPVPGFTPSTWLVRRTAFQRVGGFDPTFRNGEDTDWLARAKDLNVRHHVAPDMLVEYRVHSTNATANTALGTREILRLLRASVHRQRSPE